MDWKDVAGKIMGAAPMLGTLLAPVTGGASVAAGGVISMIGSVLGLKPDETTPDAVSTIITQNPDALLKLKELELNHAIELQRLVLQAEQARLADVQGARQRQIDSEKSTGKRDYNLYILSWVTVVGFYALIALLIYRPIGAETSPAVFMLFGALGAGFGAVMQYFFGSSKGSAEKTAIMVKSTQGPKA